MPPPWLQALAKAKGKAKAKAKGTDRPQESFGPPPAKAEAPADGAAHRSCSRGEQLPPGFNPNAGVELDVDTISPTAVVFGEGSGVQMFDLNTGKSVCVHQRTIASYHWLCSIDFHNVLDVSRTGVHVAWQGPFSQLFEDVKRALVCLHYICKRMNGLLFVHADFTRQHVLQIIWKYV